MPIADWQESVEIGPCFKKKEKNSGRNACGGEREQKRTGGNRRTRLLTSSGKTFNDTGDT
jgi:hypothetical protein